MVYERADTKSLIVSLHNEIAFSFVTIKSSAARKHVRGVVNEFRSKSFVLRGWLG